MSIKLRGCMKLVARMHADDQETLLARLDNYIETGIPAKEAQAMAARDMHAEMQADHAEFMDHLREQHPDLFEAAPAAPEVSESTKRTVGDNDRDYTPEQRAAFERTGRTVDVPTLKERVTEMRKDLGKKMAQGIADQFAPIKDLTKDGYMLSRLSKGAAGAVEAMLHHGKLKLVDGVYDADRTGGAIERVFQPLRGEGEDFLWWVAGNRAEKLSKEDRENLFSAKDIAAHKSLADGKTDFDFTLRDGSVTRDRAAIYKDTLATFDEFNKNALDMAEQSGLIDGSARKHWEQEFYVPFYRVSDATGEFIGGNIGKGLVRQQAFEKLKGGTDKLNSDLMSNTLMNWSHLIDASAKNRAAKATLEAAAAQGKAVESDATTIAAMGKAGGKAVWFMDEGQKRSFLVEDPHLLSAINGLEFAGMKGPLMDALSTMKHWLTVGVTASPAFKIRNLIRDTIQTLAVSPIDGNPVGNVIEGFKASNKDTQTYVSSLAGGGLIRFGTMLEGKASERVRQLIKMGVDDSSILDSDNKLQSLRNKFEKGFMAYTELGNRGEEINRAALYKQLTEGGMSHGEASFMARDLMDFSMQGSWNSVRFITQVVPFMNARIQGLYKLGKAAKEDPARFATVLGAAAMASIALMAAQSGDEDFEKLDDSTRDNFWSFKVGGVMYHIPKPFEIGALATLAERGVEMFVSPEMTKERFLKRVGALLSDNLNMNPIPQAVKPIMDIYANKDSFSGRPIEKMGQEKLDPSYRFDANTSMVARGASTAINAPLEATGLSKLGINGPSPMQMDHLIRGYFSWVGSFAVGAADMLIRPLTDEPSRPTSDYFKLATQGFVSELPAQSSRYVTDMYEQAKVLEQAYGTYHDLIKQGKTDDAREYGEEHRDELMKYPRIEGMKKEEARINEQIRMIERSALDPDDKKERISQLKEKASRNAQQLAPV